ncbi:MAG: hypothetical protein ACRYFU_21395 [Janthinobacterium lividum]
MSILQRSIALTTDPARNGYQVQKAHYLLGRLLLKSGKTDEGNGAMAHEALAKIDLQAGKVSEAAAHLKLALAAHPADAALQRELADASQHHRAN